MKNKLNMEVQQETTSYEQSAKQGGWKNMPHCRYLIRGDDGKLYCSHYYDQARSEMLEKVDLRVFEDVGLDQGPDSEVGKGNLVRECSVKECPSFWQKASNKISSGTI